MYRLWMVLAGLNGFLAVALGAFGAHNLVDVLPPAELSNFESASQFQFYHALGLVAVGWLASRGAPLANLTGVFFMIGIICFSGSLYLSGFTESRVIGLAAPFGGAGFMLGWIMIMVGALRDREFSPAA